MSRTWSVLAGVLSLALWTTPQAGATVLFEGTGSGLSATASFTISGAAGSRQLTILLTNTDTASGDRAPTPSNEVLTGLYFNLGTMAFTPVPASRQDPGPADNGRNGLNFGIVPAGWVEGSGKGGGDNDLLVAATVRFVLSVPEGLAEDDLSSVWRLVSPGPTNTPIMAPRPR